METLNTAATAKPRGPPRRPPFRGMKTNPFEQFKNHTRSDNSGMLEGSEAARLAETLARPPTKVSVPLSATTRGVGFATASFHQALIESVGPIMSNQIVSVHILYRVHLLLLIARQIKAKIDETSSLSTTMSIFPRFTLTQAVENALNEVSQIPGLVASFLDTIGHVTDEIRDYVVGIINPPSSRSDLLVYRVHVIHIQNLLQLVTDLSDPGPNRDEELQTLFCAHNSIPGATFDDDFILTNPQQVIPAGYGEALMLQDINAYKDSMRQAMASLPPELLSVYSLSGKASKAGLVSLERPGMSISSSIIMDTIMQRAPTAPIVDINGIPLNPLLRPAPNAHIPDGYSYNSAKLGAWIRTELNSMTITLGVASMVGEELYLRTRHNDHAAWKLEVDPLKLIFSTRKTTLPH